MRMGNHIGVHALSWKQMKIFHIRGRIQPFSCFCSEPENLCKLPPKEFKNCYKIFCTLQMFENVIKDTGFQKHFEL
jgi:hypothetical protein